MNLSNGRLAPVPGSRGLVVRTPGAVLYVLERTPAAQARSLADTVRARTEATPARALARDLTSLLAADDDGTLPGFALVAGSTGGTYVKVYGGVEVVLTGPAGAEVLSGVGSFTGVDREIAGAFTTIAAHAAGAGAVEADPDVDVQGGTAAGDGFVLTAAGDAPAPAAEAPPVATADLPPTEVLAAPVEEAPAEAPPDVPPAEEPAGEAADVAAMHVVSAPSSPAPARDDEDVVADVPLDPPTEAWTPSTADFDADDVVAGEAASEPAWGSTEPDAAPVAEAPVADGVPLDVPGASEPPPATDPPSLAKAAAEDAPLLDVPEPDAPSDQPSWYVPPVTGDAPGTATPVPPSAGDAATPSAPPAGEPRPTAWEDLPVADDAAPHASDTSPPLTEPATMAIPPMPAEQPSAETAAPVAQEAPEVPVGSFTSQLLGALDDDEVEEREALPVELDPAEVRQADHPMTEEVMVQGVICSRGHFNDPRSRFCSSCGISMVQNTQILTQGPRPPLGVMVFEDGATFSLSSDYVVGRQPDVHELVQQGLALPLPVDDPERSISRAHAELRLVDWDVHLVNLSGTNGSFVWDESGQSWIPIPEGQSVVLTPGMRVALGRRSAVFESSLVR